MYLTGSYDNAVRGDGLYDTNEKELLTYVNYLGNLCTLDPVSPAYPWGSGRVGVAFYLVNSNGKPIVDLTTGETGSFENAIKLSNITYQQLQHNEEKDILPSGVPVGYKLYATNPSFNVMIDANDAGTWEISDQ